MGDRVSISFRNGDQESVALFSHSGGEELVGEALGYVEDLKLAVYGNGERYPLDRLEPETVIVDFIRYLTNSLPRVKSNYYLGIDETDGDNSDNGHHIIELS